MLILLWSFLGLCHKMKNRWPQFHKVYLETGKRFSDIGQNTLLLTFLQRLALTEAQSLPLSLSTLHILMTHLHFLLQISPPQDPEFPRKNNNRKLIHFCWQCFKTFMGPILRGVKTFTCHRCGRYGHGAG